MKVHDKVRFVNPSQFMEPELIDREGDIAEVMTSLGDDGFQMVKFDSDRDSHFGYWRLSENQMKLIE